MFDLFRAMPSKQIEHHGICPGVLEGLVLNDPLSENGGEMLDSGNVGEAPMQPPARQGFGQFGFGLATRANQRSRLSVNSELSIPHEAR